MTLSAADPPADGSRRQAALILAAAAALLGLHALLGWLLRAPSITTGQDDAVYLLLARGLRHFSYHNVWLVEAPAQAQYPPLYPALLGLSGLLTGDRLSFALALNILLSTASLAIGFLLVRRWSALLALLLLAVCAVNPWLVRLAGQITSEPLFALCLLLTLWWVAAPRPSSRTRTGAAAFAIAAALTRVIGVAVVAALFLNWMLERRFRTALALAGASTVLVGAWLVWMAMAPRGLPGQSYLADALYEAPAPEPAPAPIPVSPIPAQRDSAQPDSVAAPRQAEPQATPAPAPPEPGTLRKALGLASTLVKRAVRNAPRYLTVGLASALALPTVKDTTLDNWLWLAGLTLLGVFGIVELWRRLPAAVLLLACYTAVLLVWPYTIERFLAPLIPLAVLALLLGGRRLTRRWQGWVGWALPVLLAAGLTASGWRATTEEVRAMNRCNRDAPLDSSGCFAPARLAFFATALKGHGEAPEAAVFLSPKSATLYYLTGRRSADVFRAASLSPEALREFLSARQVEYILLSRVHLDQRILAEQLQPLCGEWEMRGEDSRGALLLRRVSRSGPSPAPDAASCDAITRFRAGPW